MRMTHPFAPLALGLIAVIATGCATAPEPASPPELAPAPIEADFVFENVNVVPMDRETVLADRAVAVRDGVIVAIVGVRIR